MARKKTAEISKTEEVKNYLAENPDAGPKQIVADLEAKGIHVSPSLAAAVKYRKQGKKKAGKKPGRKPGRKAANGRVGVAIHASDLIATKELADQLGGISQVRKALETLEALGAASS